MVVVIVVVDDDFNGGSADLLGGVFLKMGGSLDGVIAFLSHPPLFQL